MDYDSSTKFISSLAKFLQSLCNGYVEFDNGVQVIGHLYLSVDTGKTIDYILNEKVCKTDENSVTFISNSFHAQPAERPKPPGKKTFEKDSKLEDTAENQTSNLEPRSTNFGTLPTRIAQNSPHSQNLKRAFSPSSKHIKDDGSPLKLGRSSPKHKKNRTESVDQNLSQTSNPASENSISSQPSPAADGIGASVSAQSTDVIHGSQYTDSYQQNFFQTGDDDNSVADESDERDIKPSIDTDVTFIKEEFAPSSCSQSGGQNRDRNHEDSSAYYSNQSFPTSNFTSQTGFGGSVRSNFGSSADRSSLYTSGQASSQLEGENSGDPSGPLNLGTERNPYGAPTSIQPFELVNVNLGESNYLTWNHHRMSYLPSSSLNGKRSLMNHSEQENVDLSPSCRSSPSFRRLSRDVYGNPLFSTCSKCGGKYTNPGMCASHEVNCNGTNRLMCQICKRVYSQMCALKEHLRGKHGLGEMLSCKHCGRSFKYKPQLYDHSCSGLNKQTVHSGSFVIRHVQDDLSLDPSNLHVQSLSPEDLGNTDSYSNTSS